MSRTALSVFLLLVLLAAPVGLWLQPLDAGGQRRGTTDPDGVTSASLGEPASVARESWASPGSGERRGTTDPDGVAARPQALPPAASFLA